MVKTRAGKYTWNPETVCGQLPKEEDIPPGIPCYTEQVNSANGYAALYFILLGDRTEWKPILDDLVSTLDSNYIHLPGQERFMLSQRELGGLAHDIEKPDPFLDSAGYDDWGYLQYYPPRGTANSEEVLALLKRRGITVEKGS